MMEAVEDRARRLLSRPGFWLEARAGRYAVRPAADRRRPALMTLDEAAFRSLAADPGLTVRRDGGWTLARGVASGGEAGRLGLIEGERAVMTPAGETQTVRANLGVSPILWLSRRRDADGRPWLDPLHVAAGERLSLEAEIAGSGPSLTMRWDALPRSGSASAARPEPTDRALAAGRRVERALAACGPYRAFIAAICLSGSSLQLAERDFGLKRRQGRIALRRGLEALARHYGIG